MKFLWWEFEGVLKDGFFGVKVFVVDDYFELEILIVFFVGFDVWGGCLGYGGGFYDCMFELLCSKCVILVIGFVFDV